MSQGALNDFEKKAIRRRVEAGETYAAIARSIGRSPHSIKVFIRRECLNDSRPIVPMGRKCQFKGCNKGTGVNHMFCATHHAQISRKCDGELTDIRSIPVTSARKPRMS